MNLAGNDPEPLELAFHHQCSTFINEKKKKKKKKKLESYICKQM